MSKAIIFDLDGTLVHSAPDLHAAANVLMGEMSLPALSLAEVSSYIGHGIPNLVKQCFAANGQLCQSVYIERFFEIYAANPASHGQVYAGAKAALQTLKAEGWALGICTNKATNMTELVVKGYGLQSLFGAVICGDSLSQKKPDPAPLLHCAKQLSATNVLYVGDS
ncbi:Phosphoglycolate phosphatase, partial [hydrothermal vent metagenome]